MALHGTLSHKSLSRINGYHYAVMCVRLFASVWPVLRCCAWCCAAGGRPVRPARPLHLLQGVPLLEGRPVPRSAALRVLLLQVMDGLGPGVHWRASPAVARPQQRPAARLLAPILPAGEHAGWTDRSWRGKFYYPHLTHLV